MRVRIAEVSHNLEFPSAQDYDVASCSKLCTTENNSPRNDITLPLLEITDFGPPARGGHFCENELKRNELFTSHHSLFTKCIHIFVKINSYHSIKFTFRI